MRFLQLRWRSSLYQGFNNHCISSLVAENYKKAIDESADFGCPNVIAFTGFLKIFHLSKVPLIVFRDSKSWLLMLKKRS